jgi:hypothetical protein
LSAIESDALSAPAAVGSNSTEIVQLAPTASELPQVVADAINDVAPVHVKLLVPRVTAAVPVFFTVTTCAAEATPTTVEGKLRLAGVTVTVLVPAPVPVPLKATTEVVPVTLLLLVIVSPPVTAPTAVGLNCTVRAND